MGAVSTSETSVRLYQITRRSIAKDSHHFHMSLFLLNGCFQRELLNKIHSAFLVSSFRSTCPATATFSISLPKNSRKPVWIRKSMQNRKRKSLHIMPLGCKQLPRPRTSRPDYRCTRTVTGTAIPAVSLYLPCQFLAIHGRIKSRNLDSLRSGSIVEDSSLFPLHCYSKYSDRISTLTPALLTDNDRDFYEFRQRDPVQLLRSKFFLIHSL
jgi:hypothetical protein